ncbi:hypothetical protein DVH24_027320 [Malus domestica]|uniref:Uncharacterized protein n=1 Tax=Malus domestica TaxID=3750 RepID=A0A498ISJ0_MALDO|nr:hypothetical protein DVH24_027320 [Malus domestica]
MLQGCMQLENATLSENNIIYVQCLICNSSLTIEGHTGGSCAEATEPLLADERNKIAEQVVKQMKTRVTLLNIT